MDFAGATAPLLPRTTARAADHDERAFRVLGLTGLVLPLCHLVRPSSAVELGELALFLAACFAATGWCVWTSSQEIAVPPAPPTPPQSAAAGARRAWLPWVGTLALCVLAAALVQWAHFSGVRVRVTFGAGFLGVGLLCSLAGALDRSRRAWLGLGGALAVLGLVWPTLPAGWWSSAFGLAFCLGGLAAAAIRRGQKTTSGRVEVALAGCAHRHDAD